MSPSNPILAATIAFPLFSSLILFLFLKIERDLNEVKDKFAIAISFANEKFEPGKNFDNARPAGVALINSSEKLPLSVVVEYEAEWAGREETRETFSINLPTGGQKFEAIYYLDSPKPSITQDDTISIRITSVQIAKDAEPTVSKWSIAKGNLDKCKITVPGQLLESSLTVTGNELDMSTGWKVYSAVLQLTEAAEKDVVARLKFDSQYAKFIIDGKQVTTAEAVIRQGQIASDPINFSQTEDPQGVSRINLTAEFDEATRIAAPPSQLIELSKRQRPVLKVDAIADKQPPEISESQLNNPVIFRPRVESLLSGNNEIVGPIYVEASGDATPGVDYQVVTAEIDSKGKEANTKGWSVPTGTELKILPLVNKTFLEPRRSIRLKFSFPGAEPVEKEIGLIDGVQPEIGFKAASATNLLTPSQSFVVTAEIQGKLADEITIEPTIINPPISREDARKMGLLFESVKMEAGTEKLPIELKFSPKSSMDIPSEITVAFECKPAASVVNTNDYSRSFVINVKPRQSLPQVLVVLWGESVTTDLQQPEVYQSLLKIDSSNIGLFIPQGQALVSLKNVPLQGLADSQAIDQTSFSEVCKQIKEGLDRNQKDGFPQPQYLILICDDNLDSLDTNSVSDFRYVIDKLLPNRAASGKAPSANNSVYVLWVGAKLGAGAIAKSSEELTNSFSESKPGSVTPLGRFSQEGVRLLSIIIEIMSSQLEVAK